MVQETISIISAGIVFGESGDVLSTNFLGLSLKVWMTLIAVAIVVVGWYILYRNVAVWLRSHGASLFVIRSVRIVISFITFALVVAAIFIVFGPINIVSGLTFSAIIALAVTFALQTTIANFIAGIILLQNHMLRRNDEIQIGGITGKVIRIGPISTLFRTGDGKLAMVSNSTLLSGPMVNKNASERLKDEI